MAHGASSAAAAHATRVTRTAASATEAARSWLAASWRRSITVHALDPATMRRPEPLDGRALAEATERAGRLVAAARPALDRLHAALGGSGCCVLLTDGRGVVLERRARAADTPAFDDWNLRAGAAWGEADEGTNAIGVAIAERRGVVVHLGEHFHTRNAPMSCVGAPVHDHTGAVAGVLDVSSRRGPEAAAMAGVVGLALADAARRLEAELFAAAYPGCRIVIGETDGQGRPCLLALDAEDLVVGATAAARRAYGLPTHGPAILASRVLRDRGQGPDLEAAEPTEIRRALALAGGNASAAAGLLQIGRATLYRKMARLGIRIERTRMTPTPRRR